MKTTVSVTAKDANTKWWIIDLEKTDVSMGRVAARIAHVLRGKHKPCYTPHNDTGDFVVVVNAGKARLTGRKEEQKVYYRHTGYMGGLKETPVARLREEKPTELISRAVKGMLPSTPLGRKMLSKLKVYAGGDHPHAAQGPQPLDIQKV